MGEERKEETNNRETSVVKGVSVMNKLAIACFYLSVTFCGLAVELIKTFGVRRPLLVPAEIACVLLTILSFLVGIGLWKEYWAENVGQMETKAQLNVAKGWFGLATLWWGIVFTLVGISIIFNPVVQMQDVQHPFSAHALMALHMLVAIFFGWIFVTTGIETNRLEDEYEKAEVSKAKFETPKPKAGPYTKPVGVAPPFN